MVVSASDPQVLHVRIEFDVPVASVMSPIERTLYQADLHLPSSQEMIERGRLEELPAGGEELVQVVRFSLEIWDAVHYEILADVAAGPAVWTVERPGSES